MDTGYKKYICPTQKSYFNKKHVCEHLFFEMGFSRDRNYLSTVYKEELNLLDNSPKIKLGKGR